MRFARSVVSNLMCYLPEAASTPFETFYESTSEPSRKNRLRQQNSVSPTPVSLNPGLAIPSSANSLPSTARHTPFRFGDSVEDSHNDF
ncbi:hypothetical protein QR680_012484 [Steinernema hermaphroditum]|uniref:Uncharacterized protein n=1 Tax=Steinernema hermaphroditum TaxID=289476 RepID=A0AA39I4X9_9BILA|nr:hypothetical protein QR680_012484 [Steinernema hermaphroditum]